MEVKAFFDKTTSTLTYVVYEAHSRDAVVIDPVLDYDPGVSATATTAADAVTAFLRAEALTLHYILETHCHADHMTGAQVLRERFPAARTAIGARIVEVQRTFKPLLALPADFPTDGSQFDRLLDDGEVLRVGTLAVETLATPGHTPADVTYRIGDAVFAGDALFIPDSGTGRCDFPHGSAREQYRSITRRLYALPDDTRVFVGHDYQPGGRALRYASTIGEEKADNVLLPADRGEEDFVAARTARDATLSFPKLLFQSVQVNLAAGRLPRPSPQGPCVLQIPVNLALG
ncbi:MAG: MBL fold metallo-hydrolase [Candidatus Lambdaproteobacteria bacterium]|nr:MBL fold metallo-hydrolase [Candidatus Lambdaproteobacteria bacterium]